MLSIVSKQDGLWGGFNAAGTLLSPAKVLMCIRRTIGFLSAHMNGRSCVQRGAVVLGLLLLMIQALARTSPSVDFPGPGLVLGAKDRGKLNAGEPVVKVVPDDGRNIGLVGIVHTVVDSRRLVDSVREIERLYRGRKSRSSAAFRIRHASMT